MTDFTHPHILPPADAKVSGFFRLVTTKERNEMAGLFNEAYTDGQLIVLLRQVAGVILANGIEYDATSDRNSLRGEALSMLRSGASLQKPELARMAGKWFGCQENYSLFYGLLPASYRRLWQTAASLSLLTAEKCSELVGESVVAVSGKGYWQTKEIKPSLVPWLAWRRTYYDHYQYSLYLPMEIRRYIFNAVYPAVPVDRITVGELPDDRNFTIFDGEITSLRAVPVLITYVKQDVIQVGLTKMGLVMARKVQKALSLPEFFPDSNSKEYALWRTTLLAGTICQLFDSDSDVPPAAAELLKAVFEYTPSSQEQQRIMVRHLMPEYDWKQTHNLEPGVITALRSGVLSVLKDIKDGQWIGMNDLVREFMRTPDMWVLFNVFRNFTSTYGLINKRNFIRVNETNYKQQFGVPLLQAYIALLAAIGMAEIAWEHAETADPSPLSRLRYVRLTPLGSYIIGNHATFTAPHVVKTDIEEFEVSDSRLLFRPCKPENPYLGIVKDFAAPVGAGRYGVTADTFLSGCKTLNDIRARITVFKEIVCENPPKIWADFFKRLQSNVGALEQPERSFKIMKVADSHPELLRLIATDPQLRQHVIRAENGYVLLPEANTTAFYQHLRELGYII